MNNISMEKGKQNCFTLSSKKPTVNFDLIYSYTYLLITEVVLSSTNGKSIKPAGMMLDYFLRFTLKKTDGDRKSFPVNLIHYLPTMHVQPHGAAITFVINLPVAEENMASGLNSQKPFYHYVEISLEHSSGNAVQDIELTIYYQDCDGLELNR